MDELEALAYAFEEIGKSYPKDVKKLLKKHGKKVEKNVVNKVKLGVKNSVDDGYQLEKSIKTGKPYKYDKNGADSVRVYSSAPHGHLIEYGHRIVGKDGSEHGFAPGLHMFEDSIKEYQDDWESALGDFVDKIFERVD